MKKIIALPIEIVVRELDAKLLLASYLVDKGFEVLIGARGGVWTELKYLKNADIIYKSITKDTEDHLKMVRQNGGKIYILDEEANVFSKNEDNIIKSLFPENMLNLIDYYLIAGEKIKSLILKNINGVKEENVYVVGHPRFDFFKYPYKNFYKNEINDKTEKYGKFILFNLNFSMGNPFRGWENQIEYLNNHPDFNESFISDIKEKMIWQKANLDLYIKIIKRIATEFNDFNIIVRPHPSENEQLYVNEFKKINNIFIEKEGNVLSWIQASKVAIHYDCTTGIETVLCGKTAIAFTPNRNEKLINWLSPYVSVEVDNEKDLIILLNKVLIDNNTYELDSQKSQVLGSYIANQTIDSAAEISSIVNRISNDKNSSYYINTSIRFIIRQKKSLGNLIKRNFFIGEYHHNLGRIKKKQIIKKMETINRCLNFSYSYKVTKHGTDVYLIKKK